MDMYQFFIATSKLGFIGIAVFLAYLGFQLKNTILEKDDSTDSITPAQVDLLKVKLKSVNQFFIFALLFLIIGGVLEFARYKLDPRLPSHPHNVEFILQPDYLPDGVSKPFITSKKGSKIEFDSTGSGESEIIDNSVLKIIILPLVKALEIKTDQLNEHLRFTTDDGGVGED